MINSTLHSFYLLAFNLSRVALFDENDAVIYLSFFIGVVHHNTALPDHYCNYFIMRHFTYPKWILAAFFLSVAVFFVCCEKQVSKKQVLVTGVQLDKSEITLILINDTEQLTATIMPEDATNQKRAWVTSNDTIATVDSSGMVTAIGVGQCTITVITDDAGYTATCKVTVPEQPAEVIAVTSVTLEETLNLVLGETQTLIAKIEPEDATNQNVNWSSDNEDIVSVDNSGQVTARKAGTAMITVITEDGGLQDTCHVTVKDIAMSGLYRPIKGFLKTNGNKFVDETGQEVAIRGMGNIFYEQDFKNSASIGFNNVRYYLFAKDYEVNSGASYNWTKINNAVAWAKKYNLTLVLAMMDRPGTNSPEFFTNQSYQDRLVNFWRALADHFKNETAISAYGLMNEPPISVDNPDNAPYRCGNDQNGHPPSQCGDNGKIRFQQQFIQYQQYIQRIVDAIREVDMNHTVIAERLWLSGGHFSFVPNDQRDCWQNFDGKYNFPDINDPANNYAYEYHCYEPGAYVHQTVNFDCMDGDCCTDCDRVYPSSTVAKWNVFNPATHQSWRMTKAFLDYEYTVPLDYIRNVKNVPAYIGEWGLHKANFRVNHIGQNRGGEQYVLDLEDVFTTYRLSTSFHPYFRLEVSPDFDQNLESAFRTAFNTQE